jgi:glycosyltransferase involved in cell wall biosynthesis
MVNGKSVSLIVLCYNNEKYIKKAMQAALSQDFVESEILICDDASTDSSWEIIKDVMRTYRGLHRLIIKRNPQNLGLVGNVNQAFEMSSGDLIVLAAGDDVSHPNRLSIVYENWKESNFGMHAICSSFLKVNSNDSFIGSTHLKPESYTHSFNFFSEGLNSFRGCTGSYSRECFTVFGPISQKTLIEDKVLAFRGCLLGGAMFVATPLVDYRIHDASITFSTQMASLKVYKHSVCTRLEQKKGLLDQFENDFLVFCNAKGIPVESSEFSRMIESFDQARIMLKKNILICSSSFPKRLYFYIKTFPRAPVPLKYLFQELSWLKVRLKYLVATII